MEKSNLDIILNNICKDVETPVFQQDYTAHEQERIIENIEIQHYPYPLLQCTHLEEQGIGEDCVACQQLQYETYKSRFLSLVDEKGYEHTHTMKAAFDYYSSLITQYRLTECDELLDSIYSYCMARGSWSVYYISAIQSLAFLRFKQGRYEESIECFKQQLEIQGPNEKIYENIALPYVRLNNYQEAARYYAQAILLIRQKALDKQQMATLLVGLALVMEDADDSMTLLKEGLAILKQKYDKPHSLMAKTLTAMGDLYLRQNDVVAAEKCFEEAVTIFINTCGRETPLTSRAMNKHAGALLMMGEKKKAVDLLAEALNIWINVDNQSFDPQMVVEALLALINYYVDTKESIPDETIAMLERLQHKIQNNDIFRHDLNTLCLLKFITEMYILNKDILRAIACCQDFINCLNNLDEAQLGEQARFRQQFLHETAEMLVMLKMVRNE